MSPSDMIKICFIRLSCKLMFDENTPPAFIKSDSQTLSSKEIDESELFTSSLSIDRL